MNTIGTSKSLILIVISFLVVAVICSSSVITFRVLADPSGPISCFRTGTVKITCCQDHIINRSPANPAGTLVTYCTDCDIGPGGQLVSGATNCSERYIKMGLEQPPVPVPPAAVARLQESGGLQGGVLEKSTTTPNLSQSMGQNFGGLLQTANNLTFSQKDNSSNDDSRDSSTSALNQSDSILHTGKKVTKAVDEEVQEQDDSGGGSDDEVDEPQHQGKNNENN